MTNNNKSFKFVVWLCDFFCFPKDIWLINIGSLVYSVVLLFFFCLINRLIDLRVSKIIIVLIN